MDFPITLSVRHYRNMLEPYVEDGEELWPWHKSVDGRPGFYVVMIFLDGMIHAIPMRFARFKDAELAKEALKHVKTQDQIWSIGPDKVYQLMTEALQW